MKISIIYAWIIYCVSLIKCDDPYSVLGVSRSASQKEIKAAYKSLAKKWHPDKNKGEEAQANMVNINEAYEILANPESKQAYDTYGTTDSQEQQKQKHAHHHFFHEFRRGASGPFSFTFEDFPFGGFHSHNYQKRNVLTRYNYKNIILPDSYHRVFLIGVFGEFCFDCIKLQPLWEKLQDSFEQIGIGVYELYYDANIAFAHELGVNNYPMFFGVVAGRLVRYKSTEISERFIRDFIQALLPHDLIYTITDDHKHFFDQSFEDNKPQCLLFSKHYNPPLLFQVVAYEYRSKVKFAYVDSKDLRTKLLRESYKINKQDPGVVILKEEPSTPVAVARGSELRRGKLRQMVVNNLYLNVPRLSSQRIFDELCPNASFSSRWLCLVLVTARDTNFSKHLWKFRVMSKNRIKFEKRNVRFLHIYENIQAKFTDVFEHDNHATMPLCADGTYPLKLLIIWRDTKRHVYYDWFESGWCSDDNSVKELENLINDYVNTVKILKYEAVVPELVDEHWHGHLWDFIKRGYSSVQHVVDSIEHPSWYNLSSIGFLLLLIFGVTIGFVVPFASEFLDSSRQAEEHLPTHTTSKVSTTVLGIVKLHPKNEKQYIMNSPPGQITIVLLIDESNINEVAASPIMQAFADAIYGYTGNSSYSFVWVSISEQLMWCTEMMNVSKFGETKSGTVIALNGNRKYKFLFKPGDQAEIQSTVQANFIGFEGSDDDEDGYATMERNKIKKRAVRIRSDLPQWLERLFDGTLRDRIRVENWPYIDS